MLGAPGAGKGTQAIKIAEKYGIPHISTGDIFRANIKNGTELGKKAKEYMDKGALVPDELTCDLVVDRIHQDDCANGFVLDGFPRTLEQARALEEIGKEIDRPVNHVLNIVVPESILVERISGRRVCKKCGAPFHIKTLQPKVEGVCDLCGGELYQRKDDNEETLKERLNEYHKSTEPLIKFYRDLDLLNDLDGDKPLDEILNKVNDLLKD